MSLKDKNKELWQVIALIACIFIGLLIVKYAKELHEIYLVSSYKGDIYKILIILLMLFITYLSFMIQIIIHEGGHLIFGLITGYKFSSFRIKNLIFIKKKDGIKLKKFSLMGTGGQCLMDPPDIKDGSFPCMLYNLGGVLANIIISIISIIFSFTFNDMVYLSASLFMFGILGVVQAIMNGVPMRVSMIDNDGYNALNLRKNIEVKKCFWNQMKINALLSQGQRLKDMPRELFIVPKEEYMDNPLCIAAKVELCSLFIDKMDFEKAKNLCEEILSNKGILPMHKYAVISEAIFCELIQENRKEKIDELYNTNEMDKFLKEFRNYPSIIRMKYAYELFYNNDLNKGNAMIKLFDKVSKTYPYESELQGERELIEYTKKLYEETLINK